MAIESAVERDKFFSAEGEGIQLGRRGVREEDGAGRGGHDASGGGGLSRRAQRARPDVTRFSPVMAPGPFSGREARAQNAFHIRPLEMTRYRRPDALRRG